MICFFGYDRKVCRAKFGIAKNKTKNQSNTTHCARMKHQNSTFQIYLSEKKFQKYYDYELSRMGWLGPIHNQRSRIV